MPGIPKALGNIGINLLNLFGAGIAPYAPANDYERQAMGEFNGSMQLMGPMGEVEALVPAAERAAQIANTLGNTQRFVTRGVTGTAEGIRIISSMMRF
jgi:hypothetical protein